MFQAPKIKNKFQRSQHFVLTRFTHGISSTDTVKTTRKLEPLFADNIDRLTEESINTTFDLIICNRSMQFKPHDMRKVLQIVLEPSITFFFFWNFLINIWAWGPVVKSLYLSYFLHKKDSIWLDWWP